MKKKVALFFLGIILFVIGFFFWGSAASHSVESYHEIISKTDVNAPAPRDTVSLITYNIGYLSGMTNNKSVDRTSDLFAKNLNKTIDVFRDLKPDFVAFQEIDFGSDRSYHVNQMEELQHALAFPFASKAVNWDKTYVPFPYWPVSQQFGNIFSGQAVVSNFPIIGMEVIPLEKPVDNPFYYNAFYLDRLIQVTKIKLGAKEMVIINVHMEAFHANTRDDQIKLVLKEFHKYAAEFAVILVGDFNSTPPEASTPYQDDHVIQALLADYQIEMAIGMAANKSHESENFTFPSDTPNRRLDYIFYNPKFVQILDARVVHETEQISDHLPVYMKFVLR